MSKTLGLVVTASVLLLTSAIVVFMAEGGLSDVITGSAQQSCVSQLQSQCSYGTGDSVTVPSACEDVDGQIEVDGVQGSVGSEDVGDSVQCES